MSVNTYHFGQLQSEYSLAEFVGYNLAVLCEPDEVSNLRHRATLAKKNRKIKSRLSDVIYLEALR